MIGSLIIGILGVVSLMVIWVVVQLLWKRIFSDHITDSDVLADRTKCSNCGCTSVCKKQKVMS